MMGYNRARNRRFCALAYLGLFVCEMGGLTFSSQHLIVGGFEQTTETPAFIDVGYPAQPTAYQQSIGGFPETTNPSDFIDINAPLFDRLSPGSDALYSSGSSMISAPSNFGIYACASQQDSPSLYTGSVVSPTSLHISLSPGLEFYSADDFKLGTPESAASPIIAGSSFTDPEISAHGGNPTYRTEQVPREGSSDGTTWSVPPGTGRPLMAAGSVPATGRSSKTKLRSASRTSKNMASKPQETTGERKTRNAHNVVEKQYRNRLNARFEGLLGALPSSLCPDDSDIRVSKGDVLDMSATYIRTLESQCSRLEREHKELTSSIDRLHAMLGNEGQLNPHGFGSDGT